MEVGRGVSYQIRYKQRKKLTDNPSIHIHIFAQFLLVMSLDDFVTKDQYHQIIFPGH